LFFIISYIFRSCTKSFFTKLIEAIF